MKGTKNIEKKRKKKIGAFQVALLIVAVGVFAFSAYMVINILSEYSEVESDIVKATELYTPVKEPIYDEEGRLLEFADLLKANPDTVGYLEMEGLVSLPVVQAENNEYYVNRTFYKKYALGTPFIDYRATISQDSVSNNLLIYGHMAKNGSYFAPLKQYVNMDFYKENLTFDFNTIYSKDKYVIFGIFITKVNIGGAADPEEYDYYNYVDMDKAAFDKYISEIDSLNYYDTNIDVSYGDELVTLSTCDPLIRDETNKRSRLVIVARKLREGESFDNPDSVTITGNTDMIMPSEWQKKYGKANPYS